MIDKIVIGIQAVFLAVLLYAFAVFFLCLGQEYAGFKPIDYTVKAERVVKI